MPSSGWLSSIRRQIVSPISDNKNNLRENGGQAISFTNPGQKNNVIYTRDDQKQHQLKIEEQIGNRNDQTIDNSTIKNRAPSKKITFIDEFDNSNNQESSQSPPFQALPDDPHIPADEDAALKYPIIRNNSNLDDSFNSDSFRPSRGVDQTISNTSEKGRESNPKALSDFSDGPDEEATEDSPPRIWKFKTKLTRSQSQVIEPRDLLSPETLLNLGLPGDCKHLQRGTPRPTSAISRLSGPKEAIVRVSVSASRDRLTPTPDCIIPADCYTAPGYSRPIRTGTKHHGASDQPKNKTVPNSNKRSYGDRPQSGSSILKYSETGSSSRVMNINMEEIRDKKIGDEPADNNTPSASRGLDVEDEVIEEQLGVAPFVTPDIEPLYTARAQPSPSASGMITPMFEADPKRVRFVEPKECAPSNSRPASAVSQYSNIIKNSTRYHYQPSQAYIDTFGHDPRICNCPCHFLKTVARRSVAVQAYPNYKNGRLMPGRTPRLKPRHSRLLVTPTVRYLDGLSAGAKGATLMIRTLLSQIGVALMLAIWWGVGALVFASLEGPTEHTVVHRVAGLRTELVIDLATDLRKVVPHDKVWKSKISEYMDKLEQGVIDATKAGYTSRYQHWSLPGALMYAASLTALIGPNGAVVRNDITKLISLPYSIIGCILILLLSINVAHILRGALAKIWCPWRRKRNIHSAPLQGVEAETPPQSLIKARLPQNSFGLSKVMTLDETLNRDKSLDSPTSTNSHPRDSSVIDATNGEFPTIQKIERVRPMSETDLSSSPELGISTTAVTRSMRTTPTLMGHTKKSQDPPPTNILPRVGAPSYLYLILVILHCCSFIAAFHKFFDTDLIQTIQGILSSTFTLDPGDWFYEIGTPGWPITGMFLCQLVLGRILMVGLYFSIWPSILDFKNSLIKELHISTPVLVRS